MKVKLVFAVLLIILITSAYAAESGNIQQSIDEAGSKIGYFFSSVAKEDVIIITGSSISLEDKILFNMIKSQAADLQGIQIESDTYEFTQDEINKKNLVLIGGEKTNMISRKFDTIIASGDKTTVSPLVLVFTGSGRKIMVIYSEKEVYNNENKAADRSLLGIFIDKKYVPAAATFLSILLLYLWNIFGKAIMGLLSDFTSSKLVQKVTAKKTVKKKAEHLKLHEYIDKAELLALLLTSIIFAATMSWTWMKDISEFKRMFMINLAIVLLISFTREIYRQYLCYKIKIGTEYVFWPFGSIMTIASTILGNTFSLASYTLLDENVDGKKFGKISFKISSLTFILSILAYVLNIFFPSIILQMIFVYSIIVVFIELFPMQPMAGSDIRKWNFTAWAVFYILAFASYVFMNFTLYV